MIFESQLARPRAVQSHFNPEPAPRLQRQCACGGTPGPTGECEECKAKRKRLQRRALGGQSAADFGPGADLIVERALRSSAEPLDDATRGFMEPRLGHDFGAVRIHRGPEANAAAQAVDAAAFTIGRDIVMADSFYEPGSCAGRQLLAHELVHTIQQSPAGGAGVGPFEVDGVNDPAELQADRIATDLTKTGTTETDGLLHSAFHLARTDCAKVSSRSCKNCVYKCGYGNTGCCSMKGGKCKCFGASEPPISKVLAVLAIIGISVTLVYLIIIALADPEPVTKLALIGLSAAQIALLLSMLGYDMSGEKESSTEGEHQPPAGSPGAAAPAKVA